MLRLIVDDRWFAILDLLLVMISGAAWVLIPEAGIWFTLVALLPWMLRLLVRKFPFQRTPFDWLIALFLITAWAGYWAAYDKPSAWIKVWFIVTTVLMYFALSAQPRQNIGFLSMLSFCIGLGISLYFFLTHDFTGSTSGMIIGWMNKRPSFAWPEIYRGYIPGLLAMMLLYGFYWLRNLREKSLVLKALLVLGIGITLSAFFLTMSRGIWAALACAFGAWILWRFAASDRFAATTRVRMFFPTYILIYLSAIIVFLYLGPARMAGDLAQSDYGRNTRAELQGQAAYFILDFPFTGGGLNSFPGLYSQYMISIPFYYFVNSYNIFLDTAIEQGMIGGLALVLIYLGSVWLVSQAITETRPYKVQLLNWLALLSLIIAIVHGLLYDYLYQGSGTLLLLFPIGFSMMSIMNSRSYEFKASQSSDSLAHLSKRRVRVIIVSVLGIIAAMAVNFSKIASVWYANLGAIQMSKVELNGFPTNSWTTGEIVPQLEKASVSLSSALQHDTSNQTANYRLGMISMLRQDFGTASIHLEAAREQVPDHRGVVKTLGYCYVWLGEMDRAESLLERIPEAQKELDSYVWWWAAQMRHDLSVNAQQMASRLHAQSDSTGNE